MQNILVIIALAACGNSGGTPDAAHIIDTPVSIDAAIPLDAPTARQGFVTLAQGTDPTDGTIADASASATFTDGSPFGMMSGSNGPCIAYVDATNAATYSAGTIDISGANVPVTLTPSGTPAMVHYTNSPTALPKPLFAANASVTFHAAGGPDLVTFSATVTTPVAVAGFTPPTMLSRAAGYTASWTAGPAGGPGMWLFVAGKGSGAATSGSLLCKVADTGSYTVAAASLALLPPGATGGLILLARVAEASAVTVQGPILVGIATTVASGIIPINP